jgi:DNA-binding CsgD family transcriptional regulator
MNPTRLILDCDPEQLDENIRYLEERLQLWKTLRALRRVLSRDPPAMPPEVETAVARQVEALPAARRLRSASHARAGERDEQIEAILQVGKGHTTREIAERLHITPSHASYFLKKMETKGRIGTFEGKWFLRHTPGAEPVVVAAGESD